jgi:glycosyltransferase involved in cell wall biosynthesis
VDDRTPILYLAPWVDLGGSDKGTIDWFKNLDRERFAPSLITTQPSSNRWLHHVEPFAEEVWALPELMPGGSFPGFILGFIESRGVQVVHIMNSRIAFDLMPDMTCLRRPPAIVLQFHAEEPDRSGYARYAAARYGNLVDAFSVTSRQLATAMLDYDIASSRIHVIHSGVDAIEEFAPERTEPFADLPGHPPRVLWPGRLAEQKDPMLTLEVLRLLRERGVDLMLHVVGDGPMEPEVRERARDLGVDSMIAWHPPSQEMARWYRSSDLLLMTSVFEGVPYVIYEALAMSVPVVAPALPGNVEFMDDDSGVIVDPRDDADQYARAVADLLGDDARRRALGARSRARMLRDFSLSDMANRHMDLYDDLLSARSAASQARRRTIAEPLPAADDVPAPIQLDRHQPPDRSVAVIVPCYQHGRYLPECIASIRAQTRRPEQIIVVDDRSADLETENALRELELSDDVTVIRQEANCGPSAARNRALDAVRANYVLPLDADDVLLPMAIADMVIQLEAAPPDVGFIYPNVLHFGNRNDYVEVPPYNLHLLLLGNYCPATSLFDRRVFDAGVSYDEEIVFGHEDWDLVLQLAERGIWGAPAHGPTFKYRRRGFSRVNAVEYGPEAFHEEIERRHPSLFAPAARARIKARWAPALSIVLIDEGGTDWSVDAVGPLGRQTCDDFEIIAGRPLEAPGIHASVELPSTPGRPWLDPALAAARGRWVVVASPAAARVFERSTFVEAVLRSFWDFGAECVAFADAPEQRLVSFSPLSGRVESPPVAVAWARSPEPEPWEVANLGITGSAVEDLVLSLQLHVSVHWRSLPIHGGSGPAPRDRATALEVAR